MGYPNHFIGNRYVFFDNQRISRSKHTCNSISTIPVFARIFKYFLNIKIFFNQRRNILVRITFVLIISEVQLVFLIEKMTYFFKNGYGIAECFGMLPKRNQFPEKLVGISQVKISGKNQRSRFPVILAHDRMNKLNAVSSKSPVTQMSKVSLA